MSFSLDEFLEGDDGFTVDVPLKPKRLAKKHAELERLLQSRLGDASDSLSGAAEVREIAEAVEELERRIDEQSTVYKFRGLSARKWRALKAEHPPKREHRELGLDFNPDTFPAAAIAACSVEPRLTPADAQALEDDDTLSSGDFDLLWQGVLSANMGVLADTPKSVLATAIRQMNGASLTTAAPEGSPEASS